MTTTERGRTLPPTAEQIEHVRQCPAEHVVLSGDKVNDLHHLTQDHWVVGSGLDDRPRQGREASRAGNSEQWHNPSFEFVVFEPHKLRREGDVPASRVDPRVDILAAAVVARWATLSEATKDELRPGFVDLLAELDAARR